MLSDGVLMRLNKQDFRDLMHEPLLRWVDEAQALKIVQNRGQWLDVRLPSEFQNLAHRRLDQHPALFRATEAQRDRSQHALRRRV